MTFSVFGLEIGKKEKQEKTVVYDKQKDGAVEIVDYGGIFYDGYEDILNSIQNDRDLILEYRKLANIPEVDQAIIEIVSDGIVYPKAEPYPVKINLDNVELSDPIKKKISKEFTNILKLLKFETKADDLFRQWYIDGRLPLFLEVEGKSTKNGIKKIILIDALQIKKIREIIKSKDTDGAEKITEIKEYYIYIPDERNFPKEFKGMSYGSFKTGGGVINGIQLTKDSVVFATSGLICAEKGLVLSYLHKAIKSSNQLSQIEDAMVIYRLSRAPERRVFYVDVGNLPKNKAEAYLQSLMSKFRNKLSYNSTTGKIDNQVHQKSILEDFWLPRREGGKGTEISTLGGSEGFSGIVEETNYFKNKLYKSLNVPIGRIDSESTFVFGKEGQITRDEVKFSKFINSLRNQFAKSIFDQALGTQLVLKRIMTEKEWDFYNESVFYQWADDSHFTEMKELDVFSKRLEVLEQANNYIDVYLSKDWVRKKILFQNEEEIEEMRKQREEEQKNEPPEDDAAFSNFAGQEPIEEPPVENPPTELEKKKETAGEKDETN